jgi:hypothetical protein
MMIDSVTMIFDFGLLRFGLFRFGPGYFGWPFGPRLICSSIWVDLACTLTLFDPLNLLGIVSEIWHVANTRTDRIINHVEFMVSHINETYVHIWICQNTHFTMSCTKSSPKKDNFMNFFGVNTKMKIWIPKVYENHLHKYVGPPYTNWSIN